MAAQDIKTILHQLEEILFGYNYVVELGIEIFEDCSNMDAFKILLKNTYPDAKPENITPVNVSEATFWEETNFGLAYRGDDSAGVVLDAQKQEKFNQLEKHFKEFLISHITSGTTFYSYPDPTGIQGTLYGGTTDT